MSLFYFIVEFAISHVIVTVVFKDLVETELFYSYV